MFVRADDLWMGVFLYLYTLPVMMPLVDDICVPSILFSFVLIAMFHYKVVECWVSYNASIFSFSSLDLEISAKIDGKNNNFIAAIYEITAIFFSAHVLPA